MSDKRRFDDKIPIHSTKTGSQYVRAIDIIKSDVGAKELDRLRRAIAEFDHEAEKAPNNSASSE